MAVARPSTDPRHPAGPARPGRRALVFSPGETWGEQPAAQAVLDVLADGGLEVEVLTDIASTESEEALVRRIEGADVTIAAGGDGTVRYLAGALRHVDRPLGVIPLGTANDFARTLGLDGDPVRAAEVIVEGRRTRIDMGEANGFPYLNVASFGLSAEVTGQLDPEIKRVWGPLSYARKGIDVLTRRREFTVRVTVDGERHRLRAIQVGVANGRFQGGGAAVHPEARIDDGTLDVYAVEQRPLLQLLLMALSVKARGHGLWRSVHFYRGRSVTVEADERHEVSVDGDLITATPLDCRVLIGALDVFVPGDFLSGAVPGTERQ